MSAMWGLLFNEGGFHTVDLVGSASSKQPTMENISQFMYHVYEFSKLRRLFGLPGAIDDHVKLQAELYKASFYR